MALPYESESRSSLAIQTAFSSLARRASVKVASLSTLDLAGVMIKAYPQILPKSLT